MKANPKEGFPCFFQNFKNRSFTFYITYKNNARLKPNAPKFPNSVNIDS